MKAKHIDLEGNFGSQDPALQLTPEDTAAFSRYFRNSGSAVPPKLLLSNSVSLDGKRLRKSVEMPLDFISYRKSSSAGLSQ